MKIKCLPRSASNLEEEGKAETPWLARQKAGVPILIVDLSALGASAPRRYDAVTLRVRQNKARARRLVRGCCIVRWELFSVQRT